MRGLRHASPGAVLHFDGEVRGAFRIEQSLTLIGSPGSRLVGRGWSRVLAVRVPDGETVVLRGLEIAGGVGWNGGGVHLASGRLVLEDVTLSANRAVAGGGLYVAPGATAELHRCRIVDNRGRCGGGIAVDGGEVSLHHCLLAGNRARITGAGVGLRTDGVATLVRCVLVDPSGRGSIECEGAGSRVDSGSCIEGAGADLGVGRQASGWCVAAPSLADTTLQWPPSTSNDREDPVDDR